MTIKIVYLPSSAAIENALSMVAQALTQKLSSSDPMLTAAEIMPLATATLDLAQHAGKLEETICMLGQRVAAYETTVSSQAPKPSSGYAAKLDQRLTATSDLLRATLDRLDQVEAAVTRLYKPS